MTDLLKQKKEFGEKLKGHRVKSLDILRGFMAIFVVICHIPQISKAVGLPYFEDWSIFNRGTEAVQVFFTLSGYLIIGLLYDEKKYFGSINIKNFYLRRILKLYPVYYTVLIFGFVFYHFLLPQLGIPYETNYNLLEGIVLNVAFLPNVFAKLYNPGSILYILWSIGVEEQFYLIVAPLLALLAFRKYIYGLVIFTLLYFILFYSNFFSSLQEYWLYYYFMSAGGAVAVISRSGYNLAFTSFYARLIVYLVFAIHFSTDWLMFKSEAITDMCELILFCALIVNLVADDKRCEKYKLMHYLGSISYGIYMYHMIVVILILSIALKIQLLFGLSSFVMILLINLTCLICTVIVSHFSYKYFESFFLALKYKFRS